jgi:heat shock protein HslJ
MEQVRNLAYHGIYEDSVTLEDGRYEGSPFVEGGASRPRVELAGGLQVSGVVDDSGTAGVAVLLIESSGGSGANTYLAVVKDVSGSPENVATQLIGDRVEIRSLALEDARLVIEVVAAGPEEPACCPTRKLKKSYQLRAEGLVEENSLDLGQLSLADLQGASWKLTEWSAGDPVAAGIEVTANFENNSIAGQSGCNRYFGPIVSTTPDEVRVGPLGATKMLCPEPHMAVENRYLAALQSTTQYGFILGKLALSYIDGGILQTLLFASDSAPP